jgi:hypothetical protein
MGAWTGSILVRIGTGGGQLWMRWWNLGFHKMRGISWVAEEMLACQEELCSMELVSYLWFILRCRLYIGSYGVCVVIAEWWTGTDFEGNIHMLVEGASTGFAWRGYGKLDGHNIWRSSQVLNEFRIKWESVFLDPNVILSVVDPFWICTNVKRNSASCMMYQISQVLFMWKPKETPVRRMNPKPRREYLGLLRSRAIFRMVYIIVADSCLVIFVIFRAVA